MQGWETIKTEATRKIQQIAQNIHQHGKYIANIQKAEDPHIGDGYNTSFVDDLFTYVNPLYKSHS